MMAYLGEKEDNREKSVGAGRAMALFLPPWRPNRQPSSKLRARLLHPRSWRATAQQHLPI